MLFLILKISRFGVEENLRKLKSKDGITYQQISAFKKEAQVFVATILNKLFERFPLVSNVIRPATIFVPTVLVSLPKTILIKWMKTLLMEMIESKMMFSTDCDKTAS